MKLVLILTFTVLFIAGVVGTSSSEEVRPETLSKKEELRAELTREFKRYQRYGVESMCPRLLSPEQIVFGNQKFEELIECSNATIDIFLDKLDDNVDMNDIGQIGQVIGPVCEIFDDIFRCIGGFGPVIDLCLDENEKIFKDKLFAIVPLIQQTVCLRNGALITEIIQHVDGERCIKRTLDTMINIGLLELFISDSTELFGDAIVCQNFNVILKEFYLKVGECSLDVLVKVKDMLGFFCDGTKCERYVHELQCY